MASTQKTYERYLRLLFTIMIFSSFYFLYKAPEVLDYSNEKQIKFSEKNNNAAVSEEDSIADQKQKVDLNPFPPVPHPHDQIPVLIIACNRPAVTRCIDSLLKYKPSDKFPIIVSQDCGDKNTTEAIQSYGDKVLLLHQPDKKTPKTPKEHSEYVAYYKIARHYKWAFDQLFNTLMFEQLIVIEDDMEIAPDFFDYFESFLPVLKSDKSLFCVSAWNDNGKKGLADDSNTFYRSDFFPGLGWMLRKDFWKEIRVKWPKTYWDDWLRHPDQRLNRGCIRPEVSRTFNFGKQGVSGGLYYDQHIGRVFLNKQKAKFTGFDPSRNQFLSIDEEAFGETSAARPSPLSQKIDVRRFIKEQYDEYFMHQVYDLSTDISSEDLRKLLQSSTLDSYDSYVNNTNLEQRSLNDPIFLDVSSPNYCGKTCRRRFRISYDKIDTYNFALSLRWQTHILGEWDLMDDIREDVARTAYMDVVAFKIPFKSPPRSTLDTIKSTEEYALVYVAPRNNKR